MRINRINTLLEVNKYIHDLIRNHNFTNNHELENLLQFRGYQNITAILNNITNENRDIFVKQLQKNMDLEKKIHSLVIKERHTSGMVVDFSTPNFRDVYSSGYSSEYSLIDGKKVEDFKDIEKDSIFDLSGVSCIFTIILVYYLSEKNILHLDKPITTYCNQYKNLGGVTSRELLKFQKHLGSDDKISSATSCATAQDILYNVKNNTNHKTLNPYNHFSAMVLRDVIECCSRCKFGDLVDSVILTPTFMRDTYLDVPEEKKDRIVSNNFSATVSNSGNIYENKTDILGISFDKSSQAFKTKFNNAPGHDGYFSTSSDMIKLGLALIDNKLISKESLFDISDSKTGGHIFDEWNRPIKKTLLGSLCNIKDPNDRSGSIIACSGKTFKLVGVTGTEFVVDPLNKCVLFIGSNKMHNRISNIDEKLVDLDENTPMFDEYIVSSHYNNERDIVTKLALEQSLLYGFLEKVNEPNKMCIRVRKA